MLPRAPMPERNKRALIKSALTWRAFTVVSWGRESQKKREWAQKMLIKIKRMPWSTDRMDQSGEKPELSPERGFPSGDEKRAMTYDKIDAWNYWNPVIVAPSCKWETFWLDLTQAETLNMCHKTGGVRHKSEGSEDWTSIMTKSSFVINNKHDSNHNIQGHLTCNNRQNTLIAFYNSTLGVREWAVMKN